MLSIVLELEITSCRHINIDSSMKIGGIEIVDRDLDTIEDTVKTLITFMIKYRLKFRSNHIQYTVYSNTPRRTEVVTPYSIHITQGPVEEEN
jgi:hypothetical protein